MKNRNAAALKFAPIETKGDETDTTDIVTKSLDDLKATVETRVAGVETKITDRLDKVEARLNRPAPANDNESETKPETKAFGFYLRNTRNVEIDAKALRVSSEPAGGYLAPPEWTTEFIRDLVQFSPIRSVASVRKTVHASVTMGKRTGITNAKWKGENQESEASEPAFGQLEIPLREMNTHVDASNQLLQDAVADVEAEVRLALAEDFGQKEGLAFVSGDGALQPRGLLTHGDVAYSPVGHASTLQADGLITLMYALPALYRNRGSWLMNGSTLAALRKIKNTAGDYIWQPALTAGQPESILGRPVVEVVDMPDVAANAFPIMFGDFATAYRIVDRIELSILVNPYLLATAGMTRFHAMRRVGADVIQPNAIRKLKIATA